MDLLTALRPLECLEQELALLYEELAQRFSSDEEASRFFSRLSFDEKSHVQEIVFVRRLARQNPTEFSSLPVELPALDREIAQVRDFRDFVPEASLVGALEFTTSIEHGVAEVHARAARAQGHIALSKMLDGLSSADRRHLDLIRSFAAARGLALEVQAPGAAHQGSIEVG